MKHMSTIQELKDHLSSEFEMKDLGSPKRILDIDISRDRANVKLNMSQSEYFKKVVKSFRMDEAKSTQTPIVAHFKLVSVTE